MANKKYLLIPVSVALHAKLKWKASQEAKPMTQIVRGLIEDYLGQPPEPASFQEALAQEIQEKLRA